MIRFEKKIQPLAHRSEFMRRMVKNFVFTVLIMGISLMIGTVGYRFFDPRMSLVDSFLNSAMLLSGMGPVGELHTDSVKIFASFFALYAGMIFVLTAGVLLAPIVHRLLHHFCLLDEPA